MVAIAATSDALCVLQRAGVVRCVGGNASGELGDGTRTSRSTLGTVLGLTDARFLGCGPDHCCATRRGGQPVCWGDNESAELGTGDSVDALRPTAVASMLGLP